MTLPMISPVSTMPTTSNGYAIKLRHLAIETCRHMNLHIFLGIEPLVIKICYMIQSDAGIELVKADAHGYTLRITGVRVVIKDDKTICVRDPFSLGKLRVLDCGHKIYCTAIIGHPQFSRIWNGQRFGETIVTEAMDIFRKNLIELADDIKNHHQIRSDERLPFAIIPT